MCTTIYERVNRRVYCVLFITKLNSWTTKTNDKIGGAVAPADGLILTKYMTNVHVLVCYRYRYRFCYCCCYRHHCRPLSLLVRRGSDMLHNTIINILFCSFQEVIFMVISNFWWCWCICMCCSAKGSLLFLYHFFFLLYLYNVCFWLWKNVAWCCCCCIVNFHFSFPFMWQVFFIPLTNALKSNSSDKSHNTAFFFFLLFS